MLTGWASVAAGWSFVGLQGVTVLIHFFAELTPFPFGNWKRGNPFSRF
ncbi:hypothetical protein BN8_04845 [Fibrisoma limi BUZ 3]|uniref:Uncharacterized protein n=1 Tax=Fibrisoma limi BUZ 3 TaxID=1185876 RepID=I2GNV0_9BACT|nr:hypothetical protein BN8_04845 [Fibrisoma limi BUZ 3]